MEKITTKWQGEEVEYYSSNTIKQKDRKEAKFARVRVLVRDWENVELKLRRLLTEKYSKEAYTCLLMSASAIRIGNEDSADGYITKVKGKEGEFVQTFGATTLKKEHISFEDGKLILDFVGKKVVEQYIVITDPVLVEYGKKFYDESETDLWLNISAGDVQKFIRTKINRKLTIKDFRTFAANCKCFLTYKYEISPRELPISKKELTAEFKKLFEITSDFLGNTPGICKSAYVSHHLFNYINETRGVHVKQKEEEKAAKKLAKEEAWKQMNADRVTQGLPRINRKRKKKKAQKEETVENVGGDDVQVQEGI